MAEEERARERVEREIEDAIEGEKLGFEIWGNGVERGE